ncbi:hypothetical protein SAMN04488117_103169 [Celeribacter baekdonensis]|uniref:Uncharacterized protein n=1 Tax=Celeribacter baekdonensis TaxID=875171 RepID=A0A1G7JPT3_9RHOB|nr:hypothetical protein SAMN04488117_103169 [Celeribacter baekdonensis]
MSDERSDKHIGDSLCGLTPTKMTIIMLKIYLKNNKLLRFTANQQSHTIISQMETTQ